MKKFRAVFIPSIHTMNAFSEETNTLEEAEMVVNAIADYTLFLHDNDLMRDISNMAFVQELVDGEWEEV